MGKFTFRPAVRDSHTPLLIGLVGPSGSGKTLSALRMAVGIQEIRGGNIVYIDTEGQRALQYAPKDLNKPLGKFEFKFNHTNFEPPFSPERYTEALIDATKVSNNGIVIIDSTSHEHEGEGGVLDIQEEFLDKKAGYDHEKRYRLNWSAWKFAKKGHNRLRQKILQLPHVFIFCFRAKEKIKLLKGVKEPVQLGWQAVAAEDLVFEMTARILLTPGCDGVPDWSKEAFMGHVPKRPEAFKGILRDNRQLDESVGREMALWAAGGNNDKTEEASAGSKPKPQTEQPEEFDIDQREVLESEIADNLDGLGDEEIKDEVIKKLKELSSMDKQREIVFKYTSGKKITELYGDQLKKAAIKILADIGDEL